MRTIEVNLYTYKELDDSAKEKAREWYRNISDDCENLLEDHEDDFEKVGNLLGITFEQRAAQRMDGKVNHHPKIWYSGFSSQGDGLCFEGTYYNAPDAVKEIAEYAPQDEDLKKIAEGLTALQTKYNGTLSAGVVHRGRYYHERSVDINIECDNPDDDPNLDITNEDEEAFGDLLRDLMRWMYHTLERDYDWRNSDECVVDNIIANDYEFTADGKRA